MLQLDRIEHVARGPGIGKILRCNGGITFPTRPRPVRSEQDLTGSVVGHGREVVRLVAHPSARVVSLPIWCASDSTPVAEHESPREWTGVIFPCHQAYSESHVPVLPVRAASPMGCRQFQLGHDPTPPSDRFVGPPAGIRTYPCQSTQGLRRPSGHEPPRPPYSRAIRRPWQRAIVHGAGSRSERARGNSSCTT